MSERIQITEAYLYEGPLYYGERTEDGDKPVLFDRFIGAVALDGRKLTLCQSFRSRWEAETMLERIKAKGDINPEKWEEDQEGFTLEEALGPYGIEWEAEQFERMAYGFPSSLMA
jgi:hypothetical protein